MKRRNFVPILIFITSALLVALSNAKAVKIDSRDLGVLESPGEMDRFQPGKNPDRFLPLSPFPPLPPLAVLPRPPIPGSGWAAGWISSSDPDWGWNNNPGLDGGWISSSDPDWGWGWNEPSSGWGWNNNPGWGGGWNDGGGWGNGWNNGWSGNNDGWGWGNGWNNGWGGWNNGWSPSTTGSSSSSTTTSTSSPTTSPAVHLPPDDALPFVNKESTQTQAQHHLKHQPGNEL